MEESRIAVLVRFARLASEASTGSLVLPLLADVLVSHVGAGAVAIVEIRKEGPRLVPSKHLPETLEGFEVDIDALGDELGAQMVERCKGFNRCVARPLVSGGGLFGSVVMLFGSEPPADRMS